MLNFLKYKDLADYSNLDEIKPDKQLTGAEACKLYMDCTMPFI